MQEERLSLVQVACRESLIAYMGFTMPWFILEETHCVIASYCEAMAAGNLDRVIWELPPRGSKSTTCSVAFPSWWAGKFPSDKIMQVGYKTDLSKDFARDVQNLMRTQEYREIFPGVQIAKDSRAVGRWRIDELTASADELERDYRQRQGQYFAAGTGTGIAGSGFNLGLIDDPLALHVDTQIPTPGGFVRLGDLKIGDQVFGVDGAPTTVVAKSPVYTDRPLFRFTSSDGESVLCDGGHWWPYMSDTSLTKQKVRLGKARDLAEWGKSSLPCLPRHEAVQYPERDLPIDPWVLGAWLGDGTSSLGRMTGHPDDRAYMEGEFRAAGYTTTLCADEYTFGVLRLREKLIANNLLNNKHIPALYLIASVRQRMALLQGLMDTDGCVSKAGQCTFQNTNRGLVDGVAQLVHSLGVKAKISSSLDNRGRWKTRQTDHVVTFKLQDAARMPRKRARSFTPTDKRARSFTIEPTDLRGHVQCITVERDDGLFLCGRSYLATHNSEQDKDSKIAKDRTWNWYGPGFYTRRQPERNAIGIMTTRWALDDLVGRLREMERAGGDKWEVCSIPAIVNGDQARKIYDMAVAYGAINFDPEPLEAGGSYAPRRWPAKELLRSKQNMTERDWQALYMQNPSESEGHIIKRAYWRLYPGKEPPDCEFVFQMYDTAFDDDEGASFSAMTTWGIFKFRDKEGERERYCLILLGYWKRRVDAPDLPKVIEAFAHGTKFNDLESEDRTAICRLCNVQTFNVAGYHPDRVMIENKASGIWLVKELRRRRDPPIPVFPWNPPQGTKGGQLGKYARAQLAALTFEQGGVFYMATRWAEEVIDEVAKTKFDGSDQSDDLGDTVTAAAIYVRQTWKVEVRTDVNEEDEAEVALAKKTKRRFYGQVIR